jgi:hypothetical protein
MKRIALFAVLLFAFIAAPSFSQEVIDISVKGISDNVKDGPQKDRMEAIMDAKRQACEKAGLTISSKTTVKNFQTVFDFVESQAEAVLLPGFQIVDVGYMQDGTYSVVLIGKIKKGAPESKDRAEFTVLLWLLDKGKNITDKAELVDKLYAWLTSMKGEFKVDSVGLDKMESSIMRIARLDSLYNDGRRFYAFTYSLPMGDLTYAQRTPMTDGSTLKDDYKIRLRPSKKYIMSIAHVNAAYFDPPQALEGAFKHSREEFVFPDKFKTLFGAGK